MRGLVLVLALVGCSDATSVLVRVSSEGLAIPADIASVRIVVDDPDDPSAGLLYESADLPLCASAGATSCQTLPITVTLEPGTKKPDATVRVVVTASDANGNQVTSDAAQFGFTVGQQLGLDFVLSPRCLNTSCAALGRSCGASGACEGVVLGNTAADMASVAPSQPIQRVLFDADDGNGPTTTLGPPQNTQAGDLVIVALSNTAFASSAGWVSAKAGPLNVNVRFAAADEAHDTSSYVLAESLTEYSYIVLVYRNVDRYAFGTFDVAPPYLYASDDITVGGTLSVSIVPYSTVACTVSDGAGHALTNSVLGLSGVGGYEEWGPFPVGPTGAHLIDCGNIQASVGQLLLVPR